MVRVFIGLGVIALGLLIYSTVDCIMTPKHKVRVLPKVAWLPIILLLPLLGAGLWLGFGKARGGNGRGGVARKGPTAPDDDPEFLRNVEFQRRQQQRREEEARRRAEQERKRREAERRAQQQNNDDGDPGSSG
ncbi:PLDc N-terminal domain-containing protein [Nesterenkonia muleiensis]|uniref:PLDc N-terminal domain-containing protein n=1 Tax=Nesterenkonia muleiensis TaxID=2282648 RepID=UPI000E70EB2E|nr:PLDc N-terminal domain-containing protein [Nesterenkonia muleiensis]